MSLTSGRGPHGPNPAGRFVPPLAGIGTYIEPFRRRIRGISGGRTLVESESVLLVHRPGRPPEFAFPQIDVRAAPSAARPEADGYVTVPWDAAERWLEEDEEIFLHPRNPYHRVDFVRTSRLLHVEVSGAVLVDTRETIGAYETSLEPRLYVSRERVTGAVLTAGDKATYCPYKGVATYWDAVIDGAVAHNAAWSYEDPLPESEAIRGLVSFDEAVAVVSTDLPPPALL